MEPGLGENVLKCPSCGTNSTGGTNFCVKCGCPIQGLTGRLDAKSVLEKRYVITGLLGRGGMGAVYKAVDLRLNNNLVAVKEMSTAALEPGQLEKTLEAFKREASMLIKLRHPSLPRVTDFFSAGDSRWYLVMDYVEGETLEAIIRRQGPIPESRLIGWTLQLCGVLDYLHGQEPRVVFRDLKPANIMLTAENEIKLIDFGIARHFNPELSSDTTCFASIGFAPPEQFGEAQTDHRSDIYSLGATLHCLLTGLDPSKNPFAFESPEGIVNVSGKFSRLIMRMLELDPGDRPQGAGAIADRLLQIQAGDTCTIAEGKPGFSWADRKGRLLKLFVFPVVFLLTIIALWSVTASLRGNSTMPPKMSGGNDPDGFSDLSPDGSFETSGVFKGYYPDGGDDLGFYAGSGAFVEWSMGADQVREILGEPQREIQQHDEYYGEGIDIYYPGLYLAFRPTYSGRLEYVCYSIKSPGYAGPRRIKVGDSIESVLQKFPREDVDRNVIDEFVDRGIAGGSNRLLYHAFAHEADGETLHKYGLACYEGDTDVINSIDLVYGVPNSGCFVSLGFEIEEGLVVEINFTYGM